MIEPSQIDFANWVDNPRARRPFTIQKLTNAEMTSLILTYYKGEKGRAIDVTYGAGTFWRKKPQGWRADYYDAEPLFPECKKASWLELPEIISEASDVLVFDPPFTPSGQKSGSGLDLDVFEGYKRTKKSKAPLETYDVLVFDPPFIPLKQKSGSGLEVVHQGGLAKAKELSEGWKLNNARGYSRTKHEGKDGSVSHKSAAFTPSMKYGEGELTPQISRAFRKILKGDGFLVFKNQELKSAPGFILYDYLIQDNGFQPDGFRMSKPKARPNHAFWMIFQKAPEKVNSGIESTLITKIIDWPLEEVSEIFPKP